MPDKRPNIVRRRPAESAAAGTGTLAAALITAGVPTRFIPLIVLVVGWIPAAVSWLVDRIRAAKAGE